jgi:hypothetical protein
MLLGASLGTRKLIPTMLVSHDGRAEGVELGEILGASLGGKTGLNNADGFVEGTMLGTSLRPAAFAREDG